MSDPSLNFDTKGVLSSCYYIRKVCTDDCTVGIFVENLTFTTPGY